MSDLKRWAVVDPGRFDFGPDGPSPPLEVLVRRPIYEMTASGPAYTGVTIISRHVDGELVERWERSE